MVPFFIKIYFFMQLSNVVVVAPGGVGTMLEFYYTWQLAQVEHICNIPIILLGDMWPELIEWVEKWQVRRKLVGTKDTNPLFLAKSAREAFKVIKRAKAEYDAGGADFCNNYTKYYPKANNYYN